MTSLIAFEASWRAVATVGIALVWTGVAAVGIWAQLIGKWANCNRTKQLLRFHQKSAYATPAIILSAQESYFHNRGRAQAVCIGAGVGILVLIEPFLINVPNVPISPIGAVITTLLEIGLFAMEIILTRISVRERRAGKTLYLTVYRGMVPPSESA